MPTFEPTPPRSPDIEELQERQQIGSSIKSFHPFIYVGVEGGIGGSNNKFDVSPPFSVSGTGGVFGINGGLLFPILGTPFAVGPRIGVLWGNVSGSTTNPPASPFFTYSVNTVTIVTGEMEFAMDMRGLLSDTVEPFPRLQTRLGVGWEDYFLDVNGTSGGFAVNDSKWHPGFTASAALVMPIADTPFDLMLRYRWINFQSANHNIPGSVPISGNINLITLGVQWNLGGATTPAR